MAFYVADCRSHGHRGAATRHQFVSGYDFTIEDLPDGKCAIRFGLGAIKNVGPAPVNLIIQARDESGAFENLNDFASRVDLRTVGKRPLECLIKVGALDNYGGRSALFEALDRILSVSTSHFRAAQSGQLSFFGSIAGVEDSIDLPFAPSIDMRDSWNGSAS